MMCKAFSVWCVACHLVGLHQDKDVVHAHGQHQEGHHLHDDQGGRDAQVAEGNGRRRERERGKEGGIKRKRET